MSASLSEVEGPIAFAGYQGNAENSPLPSLTVARRWLNSSPPCCGIGLVWFGVVAGFTYPVRVVGSECDGVVFSCGYGVRRCFRG